MYSILISCKPRFKINREKIKKTATEVLGKERLKIRAEVSLNFVGTRKMRQLNLKYRSLDYPTNVLSFPLENSTSSTKGFISSPDKVLRLGDIVICYPQAQDEAAEKNIFVDEEIEMLVHHGLEHLLGRHHAE